MEPDGSLPPLQEPATCPYPEPDKSSACPPAHFLKMHLNIIPSYKPGSSKWSLSLRFPHQNSVGTSFLPHSATCPAHLILLNLISRIILGEEYRLLGSLLCSFLHPLVTSSLLGPNILLSTLFLNTLSLSSSLMCKSKLKLHLPFYNIRYFDCAAAQICCTSGVSSVVEMFLSYTHDFIDCHVQFGARENNTLFFNLLSVHWKTGLQYHCGWLAVCLSLPL